MNKDNTSSNKSFGIVFFVVFLLIALYPLLNNNNIRVWSLVLSLIFLTLGLTNSVILNPLNALWFRFGVFLGKYLSPIIMGIVYFVVVFPTFLILSVFKKNYLNIRYDKNINSYWVNVKNKNSSMKDQF